MNMLLAVALGGAVGAVLRYKITLWSAAALGAGFPYGTLFVNVVGAFAMGLVVQWLAARGGVAWSGVAHAVGCLPCETI